MTQKFLILILLFYFLILIQTSFLVHFDIKGYTLNLILILVILFNFFEKPEKNFGIFSAFIGGFFLDIFSESPLGFHILVLVLLAILIKFILKRYIQIPSIKKP